MYEVVYLAHKSFHPRNFRFARSMDASTLTLGTRTLTWDGWSTDDDIFRLRVADPRGGFDEPSLAPLCEPPDPRKAERRSGAYVLSGATTQLMLGEGATLAWRGPRDLPLLDGLPDGVFGRSGSAWLFQFVQTSAMRFFGLGEKSGPFRKEGKTFRFWNMDVWADFALCEVRANVHDPEYISIPYVVVQQGDVFIGILVDNPWPASIGLSPSLSVAQQMKQPTQDRPHFYLGAEGGLASLVLVYGPSLAELTRKFQCLVGRAPLPPRWSLGHQQSRWGYRSCAELADLADRFEAHEIPNDGLWLDIDYMDGYRVFTTASTCSPDLRQDLAALRARGYRVVPILDPGVKQEAGFSVYDEGKARDIFCRNEEGDDFVGLVWPGWSVFPDFSLEQGRRFWAEHVERFAELGFEGVWIDMNDPSTGPVDCTGMRFGKGEVRHEAFHNQYAAGMARATLDGLSAALGDRRPFVLSRSGSTGSQRYCAHWMGDNYSSYTHLRGTIPRGLNLSLSGMSFVGADVPGFGGDATDALARDWIKLGFLSPLLRNHAVHGCRRQEPWAFDETTLACYRHFVQLRYRFLPYLYDLFAAHELHGEAIWRPLFYDFPEPFVSEEYVAFLEDQFMVGPALMQAPIVEEGAHEREVFLPADRFWDARTGQTHWGGPSCHRVTVDTPETPLYVRAGAIVPMLREWPTRPPTSFEDLDLFVVPPGQDQRASFEHVHDDGATYAYRRGERSGYTIATSGDETSLEIAIEPGDLGYGGVAFTPVTPAEVASVTLVEGAKRRTLAPYEFGERWTGREPVTLKRWS